jgi:FtsZ-binding cell division protein ZapB
VVNATDLTPEQHIAQLIKVNQRQADTINLLQNTIANANRRNAALQRANDDLRHQLEAHDMAQVQLGVGEPDPLGNDWRDR